MSRLLHASGEVFANGEARFSSRPATEGERLSRMLIEIQLAGVSSPAVLDTGGAYLVIDPGVGHRLGLTVDAALGHDRIVIRGFTVEGTIHRVPVTLSAHTGEPLTFEATAFWPDIPMGAQWTLPTYLGWQGCLERIRFAVDPGEELIYFGARTR
ncbi:MAG TPA: hypothetical protein VF771_17690 [Longimicrobiaceae bacterium]